MKDKKGFTLIELLVVISIIALLLSVLLPALRKAKAAAQSVVCLSNLKQCGYVASLYAAENKNKFQYHWEAVPAPGEPPIYQNSSDTPKIMWMYAAESYYQDVDLMICPTASKTVEPGNFVGDPAQFGDVTHAWFAGWAQPLKSTGRPAVSSYAFNDWLGSNGAGNTSGRYRKVFGKTTAASQPNQVPLMMEGSWYHSMPSESDLPPQRDPREDPQQAKKDITGSWMSYVTLPRHQQRTQGVMLDGSTAKIGLRSIWKLKWHNEWKYSDCTVSNPNFDWKWMKSLPE
jgi:prepilin-type N-terminal cleavage/methylation domain-containing protein